MINWKLPPTLPLVPSSANKKSSKCLGSRWSLRMKTGFFLTRISVTFQQISTRFQEFDLRLTKVWKIHKRSFLTAHTDYVWWFYNKFLFIPNNHLGIFTSEAIECFCQQFVVRIISIAWFRPRCIFRCEQQKKIENVILEKKIKTNWKKMKNMLTIRFFFSFFHFLFGY